jgi:signal transduction histidine kinase
MTSQNYLVLKLVLGLGVLATVVGLFANPMILWLGAASIAALCVALRAGYCDYTFGKAIIHRIGVIMPVMAACYTTAYFTQFDCGGKGCNPNKWLPHLKMLALTPIILSVILELPFRETLWSRTAILTLTAAAYQHVVQLQEGTVQGEPVELVSFTPTILLSLLLIGLSYKQESMAKTIFSLQYAESTSILGSVSHDLRTPLSVVRFILRRLRTPKFSKHSMDDPQIKAELAKAEHGCKRIDGLVEDLLLASTMYNTDGKGLVLERDTVNIREFMQQHAEHIQYKLKKAVAIELRVDDPVPCMVVIDEKRLSQIVTNLLTNAAKFTLCGEIKLLCTLVSGEGKVEGAEKEAKSGIVLKISVQDTGIGISDIGVQKLKAFQLFNKLSDAESDRLNPNGTGLGLSICNKLAMKLGGARLELVSTVGQGKICLRL